MSEIYPLQGPGISKENSRCLKEIKDVLTNLKIYLHASRYDATKNEGDVYGYVSRVVSEANNGGIAAMTDQLYLIPIFVLKCIMTFNFQNQSQAATIFWIRRSLVVLRYLDFMPFIDRNYHTPIGYRYFPHLFNGKEEVKTKVKYEFNGHHNEMLQSGGAQVFVIPENLKDLSNLHIKVMVKKDHWKSESSLMVEPDWSLVLDENHNALKIGSRQQSTINARIYLHNQLAKQPVNIYFESQENDSSPLVAEFTKQEDTTSSGIISAIIQAHDLEHSGEIDDPVTRDDPISKGILKGNLPWDRYYGNLVSIKIGARTNPVAQIDILVRVLHAVNLTQIPKNKISFRRDILPLFSYYLRYFPWLHVNVENCQYTQFLDIADPSAVKGIMSEMSIRLEKDDDDWQKMPRSRDFPVDGDKLIKRLEKEDMLV